MEGTFSEFSKYDLLALRRILTQIFICLLQASLVSVVFCLRNLSRSFALCIIALLSCLFTNLE